MASEAMVRPDSVYRALRSSIIEQVDAPGSTLTEHGVAERFGVARPTAKLAIERLVAEGLLRREAHRAARVPQLDRGDLADLFENRALIECAALGKLASEGAIPAAALDAHRALLQSAQTGAPFAEHDIEFHRALVSGQPSERLSRMHSLLMGEIELCIRQVQASHLLAASEVAQQHQGILDAITSGDAHGAAALTRAHIEGSRDRLLAHLDTSATDARGTRNGASRG